MENLWEYVEPLETETDNGAGERQVPSDTGKDQRALARICLSIEPSLYQYVREAKSAQDAWNKLAAIFEDRGLYRRVLLLRQLHRIEYKSYNSMQEYINAIMTIVSQLSDIGK
ncbi:hypothetical protein O0L34_g9235 [Tuta absoluta]|nr:hypothetical protein O0L34_g9235 [Tuta absoluta]